MKKLKDRLTFAPPKRMRGGVILRLIEKGGSESFGMHPMTWPLKAMEQNLAHRRQAA